MAQAYIPADSGSEVFDRALIAVLTDLPEDRSTPLDGFIAESLLREGIISKKQLIESIDACKNSPEPVTLFNTMHSRGDINDSHIDKLLKRYKEQNKGDEESEIESDVTFGEIAVQKKVTTRGDLWAAIEEQERKRATGSEHRLGEIMVNRGTLTISQAKDILVSQGKQILHCPACGEQYNVANYSPDKEYSCLSCGGALTDTGEINTLEVRGTAFEKTMTKPQADFDSFIGREIGGCKILSKIGEGGMGAVYKAHHQRLNKVVAFKVMAAGLLGLGDEIHRKRFLREARAAAQLDHPNIMTVFDVNEFEGSPYIIMQYIEGKTVGDVLDAKGKFGELEALDIIAQAAEALGDAQQHNIVHRDIKPDNIMITESGQVKVMDFGLAKRTGTEDAGVTASGVILGTPVYMSPEQFKAEVLDGRSDTYSLGITFFHMVAGRPPFTGKTPYELGSKHTTMPPPSPKTYSPELNQGVCSIINRMIAKDKKDRYASAAELTKDLKDVREKLTVAPLAPAERAVKKNSLKYIIPAAIAVIALVIFGLLMFGGSKTDVDEELEKRARDSYVPLKEEVNHLLPEKKFYECLQVLGRFPAEFSHTQVQNKVDAEKTRVVQAAIAEFEKLLETANKLRGQDQFEQAATASRQILDRLGKIEKDISDLPEAVKLTQIRKDASDSQQQISVSLNTYREFKDARIRAESFLEQDKPDEAQKEIKPYTEHSISSIKSQANELMGRIEQKRKELVAAASTAAELQKKQKEKLERTGFEEAKKLAADDRKANRYKAAREKIGLYKDSFLTDVKEEAKSIIAEIDAEALAHHRAIAESELKQAEEAFTQGRYKEAAALAGKYKDDFRLERKQKTRAATLAARAQAHIAFENDLKQVKQLVAGQKFEDARGDLDKWLDHGEKSIAAKAAAEYAKIPPPVPEGMVYVAPGTFNIGSNDTGDHNPQRIVTVSGFFIDKYEVTNAEYAKFVKATGHKPPQHWTDGRIPKGKENHPVIWVTYDDAAAYAKLLGKRLPTGEEWEIAAGLSDGKILSYPWGDKFERNACNMGSRGCRAIGSFLRDKSPLGLFDVAGNVSEWTASKGKDANSFYIRGGDWGCRPENAQKITYRFVAGKGMTGAELGFRCAKDAK